jgi:phage shock protein C
LAQRAQQRALRKEEQAQDAAERSERLAERAQRRPKREKDLDQSIEDLVDQVAEKWTRKAEDWIDGQSDRIFNNDSNDEDEDEDLDAEFEQVESELDDDLIDAARPRPRKRTSQRNGSSRRVYSTKNESRKRRRKKRSYGYAWNSENWDWGHYGRRSSRRASRKRRRGNLYRDTRNKKICGVCAGTAEYMGMETWHVRLIAVMGLIFIPTVAMTVYFVTYFLMDKKPYYRQVTDRFDDLRNNTEEERPTVRRRNRSRTDEKPEVTNREAMRVAKEKFGDIEQRLRCMETAVTSSTFELQRELSKISGEDN